MVRDSIFEDLAAIALPLPRREEVSTDPPEMADHLFNDLCEAVAKARQRFAHELAEACTHYDDDRGEEGVDEEEALLRELARARNDIREAQERLRLLLAYSREFQGRRPFPLSWLAEAADMSGSGVRTAYGPADIQRVAELLEVPVPGGVRSRTTT